jgi:DNA-binding beta-propeller fold protein YncE
MPTSRALVLLTLALSAACASGNPPPENTPGMRSASDRTRAAQDSARRNTVVENQRPDAPARAGILVVANQDAATASIVDAASMKAIATLRVGVGPHEAAVSPDGRWAVVTNYGNREVMGNTLSVIDLAAPTPVVTRTIDLGEYHRPHGAAFIRDGRKLLVTSETSQSLVVVDFASGKVDTALATNGKGSHMVAVRRDGKRAWTANIGSGTITEFDLDARRTVRSIPAAPNDEGIATTPGGILVWVGSNSAKTVTIIDTERGESVATLSGFGAPYRIGISRTGRVAVIDDEANNKLWLYDVASRKEIGQIDLTKIEGIKMEGGGAIGTAGAAPEGITFDPIADLAYVTLHGTNQVIAVDLNQRKVVGFGYVGAGPDGIAFSPLIRR